MLNKHAVIIMILLIISLSVSAEPSKFNSANKIKAVWNLSEQPCNGGGGNSMERHPKEKEIIISKKITIKEAGFSYLIPQLPDVKETIVKLFLNDKSRGVIDHYFLISDQDLKAPFAAIVVTELPPEFQNIEKAFDAVNTLQNKSAFDSGIKIKLNKIKSVYGEALELIINNRVGTHCFPTSTYEFLPKGYKNNTIGISRFVLINKKLVEFSLIVNTLESMNNNESVKYAQSKMNLFWAGIENIK